MMNQNNKEFIFAVIVMVVLAVLLGLDKISSEDFLRIVLLLIGAVLGVVGGYAIGRHTGFLEGSGDIG